MAETSTGRQLSSPCSVPSPCSTGSAALFHSLSLCLSLAGDLFYVNVDMSNHSKWFRFRFPRELAVCVGSSQLPAIKHAIAALVSDVLVVVFPLFLLLLLLLPLTGCECDILRVSVSHCCWGRLETEGFQPGLHTMRHVKFFFALSAVAFPLFPFPFTLALSAMCVVVFFFFSRNCCQLVGHIFNAAKMPVDCQSRSYLLSNCLAMLKGRTRFLFVSFVPPPQLPHLSLPQPHPLLRCHNDC